MLTKVKKWFMMNLVLVILLIASDHYRGVLWEQFYLHASSFSYLLLLCRIQFLCPEQNVTWHRSMIECLSLVYINLFDISCSTSQGGVPSEFTEVVLS